MQEPLYRISFEAASLLAKHRPKLHHANKVVLLELAYPPGSRLQGIIEVTRRRADVDEDLALGQHTEIGIEANFYDYPRCYA
jgi:hypothetical protein